LVHAIYRGADAAQAFVAPVAVTSLGRLAGYSEVLMQRIDDQARLRQGWPVPLRGTGMAFRAELLAELAPALHTSTEDFELNVLLAARGAKVKFVPEAVVFDPKPQSSGGAARQRARWLRGQLQVLGDYRREIFRGFKSGGIGTWQLLLLLALRPKMLFLAARMLALPTVLWWLAAAGLALDLVYYLSVFLFVSDSRRYLIDILALPRYAMLWLRTLSMAAFHRDWLRGGR
jgi:cellulose synthase/poly-beta-1,6-N-acetylglucosamine synthase-like glycosyltransferase